MQIKFQRRNQNYKNSESVKNTITMGVDIFIQMYWFSYENNIPKKNKSRLLKMENRKKYDYIGRQYLYPQCINYHMEMIFQQTDQNY